MKKPVPPRLLETLAGWLLPGACREEVLGDLHERYRGPWQYAGDALRLMPLVMASQMRRATDPRTVVMEACTLYVSLLAAAWRLDRTLIEDSSGLLRLAIPACFALLALKLRDVYSASRKRRILQPVMDAAWCVGGMLLSLALLLPTRPDMAAPYPVLILAGAITVLPIAVLRTWFPPGPAANAKERES